MNSTEWFYKRLAEKDAEIDRLHAAEKRRKRRRNKVPDLPHIVEDGTPYVPFMSDEKRELVRHGKWDEAVKLPNYMLDCEGRLYIEVLTPTGVGK